MEQFKSNVNKSSNIQTYVYLLSLTHLSIFYLEHLELFLVSVKVNQYQTWRLRAAFLNQAIKTIYLSKYDLFKKTNTSWNHFLNPIKNLTVRIYSLTFLFVFYVMANFHLTNMFWIIYHMSFDAFGQLLHSPF